jgi:hypothetical protein
MHACCAQVSEDKRYCIEDQFAHMHDSIYMCIYDAYTAGFTRHVKQDTWCTPRADLYAVTVRPNDDLSLR